jgi:hypothetical protein
MLENLEELRKQFSEAKAQVSQEAPGQPWDKGMVLSLSFGILLFGLIVISLMTYLLRRNRHFSLILPSFGVPLIIVAAVVLVIAGFGERQIAPVIGLLGTIAGYLLGRESSYKEVEQDLTSGPSKKVQSEHAVNAEQGGGAKGG